jgi:hypothetical protein
VSSTDFTKTLTEELDFRSEAENLDRFNEIMREPATAHSRRRFRTRVHDPQAARDGARSSALRVDLRRDQGAGSTARAS